MVAARSVRIAVGQSPVQRSPAVAASLLTDNFDDNSTDAARWVIAPYDPANSTTGMTVAEANARLELTGPALDATTRVNGYVAAGVWSMAGSAIFVQFQTVPQSSEQVLFGFKLDDNNYVQVLIDANLRLHQHVVGSGSVIAGPIAFSTTTHRWLRLRHDDTNSLLKLDTATSSASNPPLESDWTERLSATQPGFSFANVKPYLQNSTFGSMASPTTHIFDGFNTATAGSQVYQIVISAALALFGTEANQLAAARSIGGSAAVFGSVAKVVSESRIISGAVAVFGALTKAATYPRSVNGTVAVFGSVFQSTTFRRTVAAAVAIDSAVSRTLSALRQIAGTVSIQGSAARVLSVARSISGLIAVPGSVARVFQANRSVTGAVVIEPQVLASRAYLRQIAGAVVIFGKVTTQAAFARAISGRIVIAGAVSRVLSAIRAIAGQIAVRGSVARTVAAQRVVTGMIAILGQVQNGKAYSRTVAAAVAISASLQRFTARAVAIKGQIAVSVSIARQAAFGRLISGAMVIGARLAAGLSLSRAIVGSITLAAGLTTNAVRNRTIAGRIVAEAAVSAIVRFATNSLPPLARQIVAGIGGSRAMSALAQAGRAIAGSTSPARAIVRGLLGPRGLQGSSSNSKDRGEVS